MDITVFISVFSVVEVLICVKLYVVLVVTLRLMMYLCMLMCVDVNKQDFFSKEYVVLLDKHIRTHALCRLSQYKNECVTVTSDAVQYVSVLNG